MSALSRNVAEPVTIFTVPVTAFGKSRFRFRLLTIYGSGYVSGSGSASYLDHKTQCPKNLLQKILPFYVVGTG